MKNVYIAKVNVPDGKVTFSQSVFARIFFRDNDICIKKKIHLFIEYCNLNFIYRNIFAKIIINAEVYRKLATFCYEPLVINKIKKINYIKTRD